MNIKINNYIKSKVSNNSLNSLDRPGRSMISGWGMKRSIHNLDATAQSFGRLASQIAILLRGKNKPEFLPNVDGGDKVKVENVSKIKITGNKLEKKIYYHYSGYQGGLRETTLKELIDKKGHDEVLRRAVWNMLPKNKLRVEMIKRLDIK